MGGLTQTKRLLVMIIINMIVLRLLLLVSQLHNMKVLLPCVADEEEKRQSIQHA